MRIAVLTTSFLPAVGGAEFAVHHLAQQWVQQGHEVTVWNYVSDTATHPQARYQVRRYWMPRGAWRLGPHRFPFANVVVRQLAKQLAKFEPHFVSAHFGYPTAIWLAKLEPSWPFLITCHGPAVDETPEGPCQRYGIRQLLVESMRRSSRVIAISRYVREVLERMGVPASQIVDIPNGVDVERFRSCVGVDIRQKFDIPRDAVVVLSVGRDSWETAYDKALRAFATATTTCDVLRFVLLGRGVSKWHRETERLGIASKVTLCDGLSGDELVGVYQQANIFFMSSTVERCPLVVPEAMAAGLPLVVTAVGGCQDMVVHEKNGLVVTPGDAGAMSAALSRLAHDSELRTRMASQSRRYAADYTWERISFEYLNLGQNAGNSRSRSSSRAAAT